jgi:hypothetical protein
MARLDRAIQKKYLYFNDFWMAGLMHGHDTYFHALNQIMS